jgi:hypothetical protein
MKYDDILEIDGKKLTKQYIESLSKQERIDLIDPIFNLLRDIGWLYPDDDSYINKEWKRLLDYNPDLSNIDLFNNSSLATKICKYFCKKFYLATENGENTMIDNFNNDDTLKKLIYNRLGLEWIDEDKRGPGVNEAFNLSFRMFVQGQRSTSLVSSISIFKPSIAKYMYLKYSNEGDTVYDYSAGWGGRLLGATSCGRKYIGVDPWTTDELQNMADYLKLDIRLINDGSENIKLEENSIDFSFSSPPYYNQEYYSKDSNQAYNNGEDYFYNTYWKNTLENVRYMLKPGKWFGLNVKNYPKMLDMAKNIYGEPVELVNLQTVRSHLNKSAGIKKVEYIYMFKK